MKNDIFISIVVPIYKAEKYIKESVESLFEQDFKGNVEYIFVNDCSPDNSIDILKKIITHYPQHKNKIKIVNHDNNKGSGAARETGIKNAIGEYIIQIDADDWCEIDMLSVLYKSAMENNSDIVYCDFYRDYKNEKIKYCKQKNKTELFYSMIISGEIDNSLCNKLIKRTLYTNNNLYPPSHISMAEDRYLMIRLCYFAKKISYVNRAFLHYRQDNETSLMFNYNEKSFNDFKKFINETYVFLVKENIFDEYKDDFYKLIMSHLHLFYIYDKGFLKENYPDSLRIKYIIDFKGSSLPIKSFKVSLLLFPDLFRELLLRFYLKVRR